MPNEAKHTPGRRTWADEALCAECCNGDRCDDSSHYARLDCPHCLGTGIALWTEAGQREKAKRAARSAAIATGEPKP